LFQSLRAESGWVKVGQITVDRGSPDSLTGVTPEIEIWRAANLTVTCYGEAAKLESAN